MVSPLTGVRGERQTVESPLDQRCEALLLLGPALPSAELAALAKECPLVVVGRRVRLPRVSVVRAAVDVGVGLAVAHLVGLGHRDVVLVNGGGGPIAALRRRGFPRGDAPMGRCARRHRRGRRRRRTRRAAAAIAGPRGIPTALVTFNDRCALGVIDPGCAPSRSPRSARRPAYMAAAAVAAAFAQAGGEAPPRRDVVLTRHLVVRSTTAPPVSG